MNNTLRYQMVFGLGVFSIVAYFNGKPWISGFLAGIIVAALLDELSKIRKKEEK